MATAGGLRDSSPTHVGGWGWGWGGGKAPEPLKGIRGPFLNMMMG